MQNKILPQSYQKRPVTIQALEFVYSKEGLNALEKFCAPHVIKTQKARHPDALGEAFIETLEGTMRAIEGDYIIRGIKGEYYPCKPSIFYQSYIKLDESIPVIPDNKY
jgi:hypothetical protein